MSTKGDCSVVYKWVLDDVCAAMAPEFQAANVDESVLLELRYKWEEKLKMQGLIRDANDPGVTEDHGSQPGPHGHDDEEDADGEDDGAGPSGLGKRKARDEDEEAAHGPKKEDAGDAYLPTGLIPQHDGDPGDDGGEAAAASPQGDEILSDDDHDDGQDEEEVVDNLLIGQFDKVNKMKNRWKVMLKDCVFHINGRDYLFKKATAEYHWQ